MNKETLIEKLLNEKAEENNTIDLNAYALGLDEMYEALFLYDVIQRNEQLFCGRNITTCIYFDEGKCKNEPSECRDQVEKDNKNSDVSFSLWEQGTCWVLSPATDKKTTHTARRNTETKAVQFYVDDKTCDNGEGYWLDSHICWWNNFIPTNCN